MQGLDNINSQSFIEIQNIRKIIKSQYDKLQKGDSVQQYLIFERVSLDDLAKIDCIRSSLGKRTRTTHHIDTDLLIVKLPTAEHERAHGNLVTQAIVKCSLMG